ncbi:MAG: lasso peptide biosynthesis PqqD family chaperone [Bacteroidota bacterium]
MTRINLETRIKRKEGLIEGNVDNEVLLLSIDSGKYYGLDDIGTRIWEMLGKPMKIVDIVAVLQKEYNVDEQICREETLEYLDELLLNEIISIDK